MFLLLLIIVLVLCFFMAPIIMVTNRKKLKEMNSKIDKFESISFNSQEEKEKAKQTLKRELIKIKSKIVADKKSIEQAKDILDTF